MNRRVRGILMMLVGIGIMICSSIFLGGCASYSLKEDFEQYHYQVEKEKLINEFTIYGKNINSNYLESDARFSIKENVNKFLRFFPEFIWLYEINPIEVKKSTISFKKNENFRATGLQTSLSRVTQFYLSDQLNTTSIIYFRGHCDYRIYIINYYFIDRNSKPNKVYQMQAQLIKNVDPFHLEYIEKFGVAEIIQDARYSAPVPAPTANVPWR